MIEIIINILQIKVNMGFFRKIKARPKSGRGAGDEGTATTFLNQVLVEEWNETKAAYDSWD